jgi:DNA-binding protein H-NS
MPQGRDADFSSLSMMALKALRARIDAEIESRQGAQEAALRARGGLVERDGPRYRNPENSAETWSGKEPRPTWVGEALARGFTLAELEIIDDRPIRNPVPVVVRPARKSPRRA